jgi:hypothetical protein
LKRVSWALAGAGMTSCAAITVAPSVARADAYGPAIMFINEDPRALVAVLLVVGVVAALAVSGLRRLARDSRTKGEPGSDRAGDELVK